MQNFTNTMIIVFGVLLICFVVVFAMIEKKKDQANEDTVVEITKVEALMS